MRRPQAPGCVTPKFILESGVGRRWMQEQGSCAHCDWSLYLEEHVCGAGGPSVQSVGRIATA